MSTIQKKVPTGRVRVSAALQAATMLLPARYNYSAYSVLAGPADPPPDPGEAYSVRMKRLARRRPVLSVLIRRAALTTPQLAATLHLCSAEQVDERADGAWHAEWDTLRMLVRRTAVATSQTADLVEGLRVHPDRMAANLASAEAAR